VEDRDGFYCQLTERLAGHGTSSMSREVQRVKHAPLIRAFAEFASREHIGALARKDLPIAKRASSFAQSSSPFLQQAMVAAKENGGPGDVMRRMELLIATAGELTARFLKSPRPFENAAASRVFAGWAAVSQIGHLQTESDPVTRAAQWLEEWCLDETLSAAFVSCGADHVLAQHEALLVRVLTAHQNIALGFEKPRPYSGVAALLDDPTVRTFLNIHTHRGVEWFQAEAMDELLRWLPFIAALSTAADHRPSIHGREVQLSAISDAFHVISDLAAVAEYQVGRFRELLEYAAPRKRVLERQE
jgi:hypothetical protein